MLASDVALGHKIAQLLAGTGQPTAAQQIAKQLGCDLEDVHDVLLRDNRFELAPATWRLLVEPERPNDQGEKTRSVSPVAEAGSTSPAPRAGFSPGPSARASSRAFGSPPFALVEVARHDPLGLLHSVHWTRHAAAGVIARLVA